MTEVNRDGVDSPLGGRAAGGANLRNSKGQYGPGRSGNPRGRPRKRPLVVSDRQELAYFFEVDRELVPITLNGRRKKVPGIVAAYRLIRKRGLEGEYRYMKLFVDLRKQFVQYVDETRARKLELLLQLIAQAKASKQLDDRVADLMNKTLAEINKPYDL
jgi:hypothetical protein